MGKIEKTARRSMESIRQQARQAIQEAAEHAGRLLDTVDFLGAYRKLHNAVRDHFTDYIYSFKGIDTLQGLPEDISEETMQWISDRVTVMLEFINTQRLQELLRRYDPAKATGEYPFFTYLESTLKMDTQKLVEQQAKDEQSHGVTNLHQPEKKTVSAKVSRRIRSLLELKPRVTYEDYQAIAQYFGITVRDVEQVLQAESNVRQQAELNRTVGEEDEDALQDFVNSGGETPWQVLEAKEQDVFGQRWQQMEQVYRESLTAAQQKIFSHYATILLIRREMEPLCKREGKPDLDSLAALFREEKELALQTLKNLKFTYTQRETPLICPEMFDLAIEKQAIPTQKDIARILQVTTANISKTYKQALEKMK